MLNKKSILDSFILVPHEFISFFSRAYRYSFFLNPENKDKIIKKSYATACDKDYLIIVGSKIISCYKNQYKQILFNFRSKKVNEYKNSLRKYYNYNIGNAKPSIKLWKSVLTFKKVEFANSFEISIYDIKKDKYHINFRPFVSLQEKTAANHSHVGSVNYTRDQIKKGALRLINF